MSKIFKYTADSGAEKEIKLKSLNTKYLKKLFKVFNAFNKNEVKSKGLSDEEKTSGMMSLLSSDLMDDVVDVCFATIKRSEPSWSDEDVDDFVARNYLALLPVIAELNFPQK